MRTTLTLDDDVAALIEDAVHRERRPMKQVINDALREALAPPPSEREPYVLPVFHSGLQPGIDPMSMNRLVGELEDEVYLEIARREQESERGA